MSLPTGTVTFLFTDIEGSTKLWEQFPEAMRHALTRHDALLHQVIARHHGYVFKTMGDAFWAVFASPQDAVDAALAAQHSLLAQEWGEVGSLRVRIALHTGVAQERDGDYFGPALNRLARLLAVGHGGQILLSSATERVVYESLPEGVRLRALGSHRLKDLQQPEHVYQLVHPALPQEFPPLRSLQAFANNLPIQLTSFVGREREMAEVKRLLSTARLLTLTGPGGCGKTRLSLQVAADLLESYPEGVWLVEMAPLGDPDLVPQAVASALGVQEEGLRPIMHTLVDFIKPRTLLLLLDNCEHVLSSAARLAETLLRSCPGLRVLATSREGLGIAGEMAYPVPSLSLPPPEAQERDLFPVEKLTQYEATRLFIERAAFSQPGFQLTAQNAPAIAQICHRLDGIPLAIELAAARVKVLPVEHIARRLDDRFRLLTGGSRTALPRQQTLRALIDWSYNLLSSREQMLLGRLSAFMGGWTLEAAEAICQGEGIEEWEVLDLLSRLVDKSLVGFEEQQETTRYRLLETVRQYSRERLQETGEDAPVRQRHRDYYLGLVKEAEPYLTGARQSEWLDRLETEHDNLRAALAWCLSDTEGVGSGLELAGALSRFWEIRGYWSEGRRWLEAALAQAEGLRRSAAHGKALLGAGRLAYAQGEDTGARSLHEESLRIYRELGDKRGIAASLQNLGNVAEARWNPGEAHLRYAQSLEISREIGDRWGIAASLYGLGNVAYDRGEYELAHSLYEESLAIREEIGDKGGIAWALMSLGNVAWRQGEYRKARSLYEESLTIYRELGDKGGIAWALNNLGHVAHIEGEDAAARSLHEESLAIRQEIGDQGGAAASLWHLGNLALVQGKYEMARSLHEESLAIRQEIGDRAGAAASLWHLGNLALVQGEYEVARSLYEESLTIRQEIGDRAGAAASLWHLGNLALIQGEYEVACSLHEKSLTIRQEIGDRMGIADSLEGLAGVAGGQGQPERAARLWGAAEALRESIGMLISLSERTDYDRQVASVRAALSAEAFETAWQTGRAMGLEKAVAYAIKGSKST